MNARAICFFLDEYKSEMLLSHNVYKAALHRKLVAAEGTPARVIACMPGEFARAWS